MAAAAGQLKHGGLGGLGQLIAGRQRQGYQGCFLLGHAKVDGKIPRFAPKRVLLPAKFAQRAQVKRADGRRGRRGLAEFVVQLQGLIHRFGLAQG